MAKLSKETLEIFKNFASINPNLYIEPGNMIRTVAQTKSCLAKAIVSGCIWCHCFWHRYF